ncbi:S8 family serine peptidase [Tumebacillus lipolyticus]|uniref:S8 family serine peptidase n=1 Tax=Tumebacillus lipolyticus TaxID=1280370 RepID=A0ABW4ZWP1_9BACL
MKRFKAASLTLLALSLTCATGLSAQAATSDLGSEKRVEEVSLLVKVKAGQQAGKLAGKHKASKIEQIGNSDWYEMKIPAGESKAQIAALRTDGGVEAVEEDQPVSIQMIPNDPSYPSQWYMTKVQAPLAWDITTGSSSRTIAIIDTGVDLSHPDFAGRIVAGYDYVNNDSVASDDNGHGTAVAGVAAASGNNSNAIAGMDWNAKIMPIKALNASGAGTVSAIINSIYFAANNGANVINLSLAGGSYSSAFQAAIDYAHSMGCIIVAAADSNSPPSYPAAYNNVVAVTATTAADVPAVTASYVDIGAPGANIITTRMGGGVATYSGSSYSAALVSGAMSLAWSCNLTYSKATVETRVLTQGDSIGYSFRRLNMYNTVNGF